MKTTRVPNMQFFNPLGETDGKNLERTSWQTLDLFKPTLVSIVKLNVSHATSNGESFEYIKVSTQYIKGHNARCIFLKRDGL